MEQEPLRIGKSLVPGVMIGLPSSSLATRVSTARHGVIGTNVREVCASDANGRKLPPSTRRVAAFMFFDLKRRFKNWFLVHRKAVQRWWRQLSTKRNLAYL